LKAAYAIVLPLAAGFLAGCGDSQAGTSTQTENHLGMRILPIDSIVPEPDRTGTGTTVATLRFDVANFDFSQLDSSGRNLSFERMDGTPIPFQLVFWDRSASRGRLKVRLDSALRRNQSSIVMRWNSPTPFDPDSLAVWQGTPAHRLLELNSVLVNDFEHGLLRTQLPDSAPWVDSATSASTFANFEVLPDPTGRAGRSLHFSYSADSIGGQYVLIKAPLARSPRCLRSMDSLVLWVRGQGVFTLSLERISGTTTKAWQNWHIDSTQWRRLSIRPDDFLPADNRFGNVGWLGVRDSITHLTLFMTGTGRFWLDDIRIHGIDKDDLR
jgi:hypothetical protein